MVNTINQDVDIRSSDNMLSFEEYDYRNGNSSIKLKNRRTAMNNLWVYVMVTIVVALFGAIYEYFSFGVYSFYMMYAFSIPLLFGILPWMIIATNHNALSKQDFPPAVTVNLWSAGIMTLTIGSIFRGVLDIYGTTSTYTKCYFIVGVLLMVVALMTMIGYKEKQSTNERIA